MQRAFQNSDEHMARYKAGAQKADTGQKLNVSEARKIINTTRDLINPSFEGWYYKKLYEIGVARYLEFAEIARKGRNPQGLFSYWLKNS